MNVIFEGHARCYNEKSPVNLSIYRTLLRRERDSNPRNLSVQRFSRPPQSTTLPSLQSICFSNALQSYALFLNMQMFDKKKFNYFFALMTLKQENTLVISKIYTNGKYILLHGIKSFQNRLRQIRLRRSLNCHVICFSSCSNMILRYWEGVIPYLSRNCR